MENAATGRVLALTMIAQDMDLVRSLADSISYQKTMLDNQRAIHAEMVKHSEEILADTEGQLAKLETELAEATGRLDRTLAEMYQSAAPEEPKKRGRKGKDVTLQDVVESAREAGAGVSVTLEPAAEGEEKSTASEQSPGQDRHECACGDVFYSAEAFAAHAATCKAAPAVPAEEAEAAEVAGAAPEADTGTLDLFSAPAAEQSSSPIITFQPLDTPVGDCELCHGYGVIEGELYGETTLVPCTCDAGLKVKGGDITPRCCEDCNIENPDCADCHLPNMDAPLEIELPQCANGSCTGNDPSKSDVCLRLTIEGRPGKECPNFVPVENCSHHMLRRTVQPDGTATCDLCGWVVPQPGKRDANPEPTPLQLKCPHPKPFREKTADGEVCKVCKLPIPAVNAAA